MRAERGFLVGPHDRPAVNEPTGETHAVGIVTTPVGCEAIFGIGPSSIRGRVVELDSMWPAASPIRSQLMALPDPDAMLATVESHLVEEVDADVAGVERCDRARRLLEDDPTRPIAEVAAELGVSHGHLDAEFTRVVGLTPRALARLLRMRRLLAEIDVQGQVGWAERAAELGWFDQAHLIRDFKRHTGVTPSQYLQAQRSLHTLPDETAAGFVPET